MGTEEGGGGRRCRADGGHGLDGGTSGCSVDGRCGSVSQHMRCPAQRRGHHGLRRTGEPPCGILCNLDRNRPALLQATLPTELSYKSVKTARSLHPWPVYHLAEFLRVKVREGGLRDAPRNWAPGPTSLVQGATHS